MLSRRSCLAIFMAAPVLAATTLPHAAEAHPGALNAAGCHRVRRTGSRHCHAGGGGRRFVGWGGGVHRFERRRRRPSRRWR